MSKQYSPSTARNKDPILAVLRKVLPARGTVLNIASGSGEHDVAFARAFPELHFQPSDRDEAALASIAAHREEAALLNLAHPLHLDVCADPWPIDAADAILNINMIHISPWETCVALLHGAARLLAKDSVLYLYGPYIIDGRPLEPSNAAFDQSLKARDPAWGLRELSSVSATGKRCGLLLEEVVDMPANNISAIFRRA